MKPGDFVMRLDCGPELVVYDRYGIDDPPSEKTLMKEVARLPPMLATLATVIDVRQGSIRALNRIKIVTVTGVIGWVPADEFHEA